MMESLSEAHEPRVERRLSDGAKSRLTQLLVGKGIVEIVFVAALAVGFYHGAFHPYFRGWSELTAGGSIAGWVVDESSPSRRVEVQLYVDGKFVASRVAELPRPDVLAAGRARDMWNGFDFALPPRLAPGAHEARVYAVHESGAGARRTLQQVGRELGFAVDEGGAVKR